MRRVPVWSNAEQKTPYSVSILHGSCGYAHSFSIQRSGLRDVLEVLEGQSSGVVPHSERAVISCRVSNIACDIPIKKLTSREQDAFLVDRQRVDNALVPNEVGDERALRTLPLLDAVCQ